MKLDGVVRIAFVGAICTDKQYPKDIDLLVTISPEVDMSKLATLGRRLKGKGQGINSGADIFLADPDGHYLGRICPKKDCGMRYPASCDALNCGKLPHLNDDLRVLDLDKQLIADPPLIVHPAISFKDGLPEDLMNELKARFEIN